MIATPETAAHEASPYKRGDGAHIAAVQAYIQRDIETLREMAAASEDNPHVQLEAARLAVELRQPDASLRYLGQAFKGGLLLGSFDFWNVMVAAQAQIGDQGEGEAAIDMAIKCAPRMPLLHARKAGFSYHRGDSFAASLAEAEAVKWDADDPEDQHAQGEIHLLEGRWSNGWRLWDGRLMKRSTGNKYTNIPQWTGQRMTGKRLLIWGEQGQGDQIQFLRFLRLAKEASHADITLLLYPTLAEWAQPLVDEGTVTVINPEGQPSEWGAEMQCAMLSLPRWLEITSPSLVPPPYAPPILPAPTLGRVGYCWRGNTYHLNDHDRSYTSQEGFLDGIADFGDDDKPVTWLNLTKGDEDGPQGSWMDTARLVASCEAIVTVDTGILHMAGSLGVPTVAITPSALEWRHGRRGIVHPWYPSVHVIRKRYIQGWPEAFTEASAVLSEILA